MNLYAFCGNNGVNSWDYLGMDYEIFHFDGYTHYFVGDGDPSWTRLGSSNLWKDSAGNLYHGTSAEQFYNDSLNDDYVAAPTFVEDFGADVAGDLAAAAAWDEQLARGQAAEDQRWFDANPGTLGLGGLVKGIGNAFARVFNPNSATVNPVSPNAGRERVIIHPTVFLDDDAPPQYAPYVSEPKSRLDNIPASAQAAGYDNHNRHTPNSNDLFMATADSFSRSGLQGAPMAMVRGGLVITAGVAGGFAAPAVGAAVINGAVQANAAARTAYGAAMVLAGSPAGQRALENAQQFVSSFYGAQPGIYRPMTWARLSGKAASTIAKNAPSASGGTSD